MEESKLNFFPVLFVSFVAKTKKETSVANGCLKVATCQFAVSGSITRNAEKIYAQLRKARKAEAKE
jgi:hypothetical protein